MAITKNTNAKVVKTTPKKAEPEKVKQEEPEQKLVAEKLSRNELAERVREKVMGTGLAISEKVAQVAIVAYEEVIMEALADGKQVPLSGFGIFSVAYREAATRPNPQKPGETVQVPAHWVPKFKVGSRFKKAVNQTEE